MNYLFDFGISQEDPLSEQSALDIQPHDRILSVASGGEVPLALLCLNKNIRIDAVDISEVQLKLCRLKLAAAQFLDFPVNGKFLGYSRLEKYTRNKLYRNVIRPRLSEGDALFWDSNIRFIENGIINAGRFEQYIRKMRFFARIFIGRRNLERLIASNSLEEQKEIFHRFIAPRKSLRLLFKLAFHPSVYKKRGLQEQALQHATANTGDRFFIKFQNFCTSNLASENYFLQYFLTGKCVTETSFPEYLKPENKALLIENTNCLEFRCISFQEALQEKEKGYYTKIHFSNLGDWLNERQFGELLDLLKVYCVSGTKICHRFLQKNHFPVNDTDDFIVDRETSGIVERNDRFPFYTIFKMTLK